VVEDAHGASLVLEYLPGGQRPGEARKLGLELARGLHALHAAGLVHGDVKASNVLFRGDGSAALGDFGAARAVRDVEATITGLARDPVEGSLAGAAPEALRGAKPGPAADVYGLGALLFRALAGEPYLRFPAAFEDAREAVLRAPPRLPHPRVPARWEALLGRALAKDPAERFPSAAAMAEALERAEG
jgi:eukaryotic-like serine/threonine-protein kinase